MEMKFLANNWWGEMTPPPGVSSWGPDPFGEPGGLVSFLNALLKIIFVVAGLFAFFNVIIAGFQFISAGGNPKAVGAAVERIWKSLFGLVIIVGSFVLAAIIGFLIFGDPTAILAPKITGPEG